MSDKLDTILQERGSRYGDFRDDAQNAQRIKDALRAGRNWDKLRPFQREAVELIATKLGRIVNGDPDYADSWLDVSGYAQLVNNILENERSD